ncbi:MAG: aminodeoxychorismate/anthranilate synthase component II [Candidatus Krumholzibacteria bacterium]|nr:aminodeoxychorismate/anthranilate synthase component II [Candidatus Krumholzibacteria bacterium]
MHLLIDNYDSFTYNIAQALGQLGHSFEVFRNDALDVSKARELKPNSIIISPGPGRPEDAGISVDLVRSFFDSTPILGICLGHQCIVTAFGGVIERADRVMHGKVSQVYHDGQTIYEGLSNPFLATRYHSLIAREEKVPVEFDVSAYTSEGEIMGVRLKSKPVEGVQFHPESILTVEGLKLLTNFLQVSASMSGPFYTAPIKP